MLSYGLELEIIASLNQKIAADEASAVRYIADTIRNLGYRASIFLPRSTRERPDYSIWNVCLDVTILEETSSMDETERSDDKENFGLELVSPIFYNFQTCNQQISHIFGRTGIQASFPATTNRSTGLHVHVGCLDGGNNVFSLDNIRALALSVIFFESMSDFFVS